LQGLGSFCAGEERIHHGGTEDTEGERVWAAVLTGGFVLHF
jgi:hypothetical protein